MGGPTPGVGDPGYQYEQLTPIVNAFLGYRPTSDEVEGFPFDIYRFIIRSLRDRDQNISIGGTKLLERFLMGPEEVWFNLHKKAGELNTLFDPEEIDDDYLRSLAKLVGFGNDLIDIVGTATDAELRKIVAGAIAFWKARWLDSGINAAVRMVTGNRFKVRDFFDFRFVIGETTIAEDLKNTDPNMISVKTRNFFRQGTDGISKFDSTPFTFSSIGTLPKTDDVGGYIVIFDDTGSPSLNGLYEIVSVDIPNQIWTVDIGDWFPRGANNLSWFIAFPYNEYLTEIRVVDEESGQGEVNRDLLEKLLGQQRPSSERFNVVYVDFMDLFQVNNDLGQWDELTGTGLGLDTKTVDNGVLTLVSTDTNGGGVLTNRPTNDWKDIQWKIKAAIASDPGSMGFIFYRDSLIDFLQVSVEYTGGFGSGLVKLDQVVAGVITPLGTWAHPSLNLETFWTYTIETFNVPSGAVDVRVLVNGNVVITAVATPTVLSGNVGLVVTNGSTSRTEETELWEYPLDISRVGPNP